MGSARLHQRIEDFAGRRDRHVQLPAEFADIGDAQSARDWWPAIVDRRAHGRRESRRWTHRRCGHRAKDIARPRSHQRQRAPVLGHIGERGIEARADVIGDPGEIMGAEAGAGDDVEMVIAPAAPR